MNPTTIQTFESNRPYIEKLCRQFSSKHGGHWQEWLSEGYLGYRRALETYDPTKGSSFLTWLNWCIWKRFQEIVRQGCKKEDKPTGYVPDKARREFNLDLTLSELTEDGQQVARVALGQNQQDGKKRNKTIRFFQELGWTGRRIVESFNEIREALLG